MEDLSWTFCIQALSFVAFPLEPWRCTSIWDPRTTCCSRSLAYAATHWVLEADYWRAAMLGGGIRPGVLPGWIWKLRRIELDLPVVDGERLITIFRAALAAELIVPRMHGDPVS